VSSTHRAVSPPAADLPSTSRTIASPAAGPQVGPRPGVAAIVQFLHPNDEHVPRGSRMERNAGHHARKFLSLRMNCSGVCLRRAILTSLRRPAILGDGL
jgi:hypothetical protein